MAKPVIVKKFFTIIICFFVVYKNIEKIIFTIIHCTFSLKTKINVIILPASTIKQARDVGYLLNTRANALDMD